MKVGVTKTLKVSGAKKVKWSVISGQKNVSVVKKENSIKITGKKAGKAKLQARTGGRKLICRITVTEKSDSKTASGSRITVKSDKYTVVYQLNNSKAAKELYNQLPLTLKVENYSVNEKIFYPPKKLKTSGAPNSGGGKGSLSYYAPWGDVVMFYDSAGPASGLYELGTVVSGKDDISKLSGKITISKTD
ncbi:MAG: hypothetical protein K2J67_07485 [Lachnospiraceae bacterium]|nr:hypothetical protein [Lachnospiraceae bacterium]